jgi:predicted component of type VI protein secretion system
MSEYYRVPLKLNELYKKAELGKCRDVGESISQHINLIITSRFGEYRFDSSFGSNIWEHDFENLTTNDEWSEKISGSLKNIIELHEPRLKNIFVNAEIMQEEISTAAAAAPLRIKQRVVVRVEGKLAATNENFETTQKLFISPLSFD